MRFLDPDHPFFRPRWRRYVTVAVPAIWAGVELAFIGSALWAGIFGALAIYAAWALLWPRPEGPGDRPGDQGGG